MPTSLTRAEHLEGLRAAMLAFVRYGERAGRGAAVPTCPGWTVHELAIHQGRVHRWATGLLRGEPVDRDAVEREGRAAPDPWEWLGDGAIELATTITRSPEDVEALVFLNDAPGPLDFWARRQCHETTIHAVDALAAFLGRHPRAADTWIDPAVALDGIDELLGGMITQDRSRLHSEEPLRIVVVPDERSHAWVVDVSRAPAETRSLELGAAADGDVLLQGPAVALYLTLWNRSDEVEPSGDVGWDVWRAGARIG